MRTSRTATENGKNDEISIFKVREYFEGDVSFTVMTILNVYHGNVSFPVMTILNFI